MNKNKQPVFVMEVRDAKFYEGTLATDTPVDRYGQDEILVMHPKSIELHTKEIPLLENHDPNKQIGIVESIKLVGKKLMGQIRFANDEYSKMLEQDVEDKIRQNLSIGYKVLDYFIENGKKYVNKFRIHEVSLVPIPADANSGFGRAMNLDDSYKIRKIHLKENNKMEESISRNEKRKLREEIAEIRALAKRHNLDDLGDDAIDSGISLTEFRKIVLDNVTNDKPLHTSKAPAFVKRNNEEYSVGNAIRGCIDKKYRGFEHEISQDMQRNQELKNEHGIIVPIQAVLGSRAMSVGSNAGNVSDISDASKLIPFVQKTGVYNSIGLTVFEGFSSDVKIPKGTSASTTEFISLDGTSSISATDPTMSSVSFSPTYLASLTEVSHKLLLQSSVDMDNYLRNLISESISNKLDLAVIEGSGSSNQPTGMMNATGINTETYTSAIAYSDLANALKTLADDDIPLNGLSWIVNPQEYATLQVKDKGTDTGQFLLEASNNPNDINQVGTMLGYPVYVSKHVTAGEVCLTRAQHSALGFFGGIELDVDPYYDFAKGNVGIRGLQAFDFQVLNALSICKIST